MPLEISKTTSWGQSSSKNGKWKNGKIPTVAIFPLPSLLFLGPQEIVFDVLCTKHMLAAIFPFPILASTFDPKRYVCDLFNCTKRLRVVRREICRISRVRCGSMRFYRTAPPRMVLPLTMSSNSGPRERPFRTREKESAQKEEAQASG